MEETSNGPMLFLILAFVAALIITIRRGLRQNQLKRTIQATHREAQQMILKAAANGSGSTSMAGGLFKLAGWTSFVVLVLAIIGAAQP